MWILGLNELCKLLSKPGFSFQLNIDFFGRTTYSLVTFKCGEMLYSRLKQVVTDHLIEKVRYLLSALEKQGCFFSPELVQMTRNEFLSH